MTEKTFLLIAKKGLRTVEVHKGLIGICQLKKNQLKNEPCWHGYKFTIRTIEGYKNNPQWEQGKSQ